MRLKDCFKEDFTNWLEKSNHPHISSLRKGIRISFLPITELEALQEILDVILVEPDADYFWYGYVEHGGKLSYTLPSSDVQTVPGDSLRVDKEKIKAFLRDYKIRELLK